MKQDQGLENQATNNPQQKLRGLSLSLSPRNETTSRSYPGLSCQIVKCPSRIKLDQKKSNGPQRNPEKARSELLPVVTNLPFNVPPPPPLP